MLKKYYELVVFDWEGTLHDTLGQLVDNMSQAAHDAGLSGLDKNLFREQIQYGLSHAIRGIYPDISDEKLLDLEQHFYLYQVKPNNKIILFNGAMALLEALHTKHIMLAVASSKGTQSLLQAINASHLDWLISFVRTAQQTKPKPDPQMLNEIMLDAGVDCANVLMIGDSACDIEMAHSVSVGAIAVNFYHGDTTELIEAGALAVVEDFSDLLDYIELNDKGIK